MKAGGPINNSYTKYKPKGNIFVTIAPDKADDLYNKYASSGQAPIFPLVGSDGGSSQLTSVLNASSYVGTTYLIYPDGTYEGDYKGGSDYGVGYYLDKAPVGGGTSYTLTVEKGSGSGDYDEGEVVNVKAQAAQTGYKFETWIGDTQYVADAGSATTTVTMPGKDISIEATYIDTTTTLFTLTVTKGSGSGEYAEGDKVSISAAEPAEGFAFEVWIGDIASVSNAGSASTTITMPAKNISVEATYVDTSISDVDTTNPVSIMTMATWYGEADEYGSKIEVDSSKLNSDSLISAKLSLTKSDDAKKEWAWVKLIAELDNALTGVTAYRISYRADDSVNLVLDQENLSEAGTSYLKTLAPTGSSFKTVLLSEKDFKQPSWHKESDPLDLSKVTNLSFAAIKEESNLSLIIDTVLLYNYVGAAVVDPNVSEAQFYRASAQNGTLLLNVPQNGVYTISVHKVNGQQLYSETKNLRRGSNTIPVSEVKGSAIHLISIEGAGSSVQLKTLIE